MHAKKEKEKEPPKSHVSFKPTTFSIHNQTHLLPKGYHG
jgi:hypothetical protein